MKANEYLKKFYRIENSEKSLLRIVTELFLEIREIRKVRHAHSDASFVSIVREQNQKWNAILDRLHHERNNDFRNFVILKLPEIGQFLPHNERR